MREPPLPQGHMDETLTHELVHSYDYCRAQLDWDNLRHLACTEVGVVCSVICLVSHGWMCVHRGEVYGVCCRSELLI